MLRFGQYLFGPSKFSKYLPFVIICGAAAFGPASNLVLRLDANAGFAEYAAAALSCVFLALVLFTKIDRPQDPLGKPKFQQL